MRFKIKKSNQLKEVDTANNVNVWGDLVDIKSLVFSISICCLSTLGGYLIAPDIPPKPLFYGLTGAFIGFIISSFLVTPKRVILEMKRED